MAASGMGSASEQIPIQSHRERRLAVRLGFVLMLGGCLMQPAHVAAQSAPSVTITAPRDGVTVVLGQPVTLDSIATDAEDGALWHGSSGSLVWSSQLDGAIGTGPSSTTVDLSLGSHIVTLTATDSSGLSATATTTVHVVPGYDPDCPPTCSEPDGAEFEIGDSGNLNDFTLNPLPPSVLIDPNRFTVSEIARTDASSELSTIFFAGSGDTDLDGDPEVFLSGWTLKDGGFDAVGEPAASPLFMFEANDDETRLLPVEDILGTSETAGTAFIRVEDFDLDGRPDVLIVGHNESPFAPTENVIYLNRESGFEAVRIDPKSAIHEGNLGDFNGDGYLDFIGTAGNIDQAFLSFANDPDASEVHNAILLFINDQAGGFDAWPVRYNMPIDGYPESSPLFHPNELSWISPGWATAFGNLDSDPEAEIVVVDTYFGDDCVCDFWLIDNIQFEESQNRAWGRPRALPHPYMETKRHFEGIPSGWDPESPSHDIQVEIFDFDNDGDNDIVVNSALWPEEDRDSGGIVQFLRNDGTGNFIDATEDTLFNRNLGAAGGHDSWLIDLNRDGFLDIVVVEGGGFEGVPHEWSDFSGEIFRTIDKTWGNTILVNAGNGRFVSAFWEGYHELTLRQVPLFQAAGPEFEPYTLLDNEYFPYLFEDGRLGFIAFNEARLGDNVYFFFDARSDGPIYTGPRGEETASVGAPGYSEYFYLTENVDVVDLIEQGTYEDGLEHYLAVGRGEGRPGFAPGVQVHGHAGVDQITLREGDETAIGYGGDDAIDGGAGEDTAVYEGERFGYEITPTETGFTVEALASDEGTDTLINVEVVAFNDFTIVLLGDTDDDGTLDWQDRFPDDATEWADTDLDGVGDNGDAFPSDPSETTDTDSDGTGNNADLDDDGDGVPDNDDDYPLGRFDDAKPGYWAFTFIEALARAGVTAGCGASDYCPGASVTRAQMAVFLERGMRGSDFVPPEATGNGFLDVGASDFAAAFIEQLFLDGITAGCGGNNYCPTSPVTRAQMAVFLLRAAHGAAYIPPPPSGVFGDVDLSHWAGAWIEQLAAEGITSGCGGGDYCPESPVTRDQMAVFLVRTFGL